MDYLMRDDAGFSKEQWKAIDQTVVNTARTILTGRRFLDIFGPLGAGIRSIEVNGYGGEIKRIPMIQSDFVIEWQEIENAKRLGIPLALAQVAKAASECAVAEDKMIFLGDAEQGYEGLLTAEGVRRVKMKDWKKGENAFTDVAEGLQYMLESGIYGAKALLVSPDVYTDLARIQPGTGVIESKRIRSLIDGKIFQSPVMPGQTAVLIAADMQNMDLAIGQDMITGYCGAAELNHEFRILETVLLRIKNKNAIVVFEK